MSRFVFLDRDGTLTRDRGYTYRLDDYRLLPGVVEGLRLLGRGGYRLAVVSNQSGIGRGYYSLADCEAFQSRLVEDLAGRGVRIEAGYFCPHRPGEGCECRKPDPGLLRRAQAERGADLSRSWMVGDGEADVRLAERAGLRGAVLVLTGQGRRSRERLPDDTVAAEDLAGAARHILAADAGPAENGR